MSITIQIVIIVLTSMNIKFQEKAQQQIPRNGYSTNIDESTVV